MSHQNQTRVLNVLEHVDVGLWFDSGEQSSLIVSDPQLFASAGEDVFGWRIEVNAVYWFHISMSNPIQSSIKSHIEQIHIPCLPDCN